MSNEQEWTNDAKILETYEYFLIKAKFDYIIELTLIRKNMQSGEHSHL